MVLLLRVLWVPGSDIDHNLLLAEKSWRDSAIQVVTAVRKALRHINKCSTMHRFFSVVESFADVVINSVIPTIEHQVSGEYAGKSNTGQNHVAPADDEHYLRSSHPHSGGQFQDGRISAQVEAFAEPSYNDNIEEAQYSLNQESIGSSAYVAHSSLSNAARVISSLSQDSMYSEPLLWEDPFHSVTQHIVDWNDFEQFLGRWSGS
jgi:hypothetical protein